MLLARVILPATGSPRSSNSALSSALAVKERIRRWRSGQIMDLWLEAKNPKKPRGRKPKEPEASTQESKNATRALRFISEGQYSRAAQSMMSAGIAPPTPKNIREMRDKHPQAEIPDLSPPPDTQSLQLTSSQVHKSIKSFKRGSAPGPSGLRAEHLKVTIKASSHSHTDRATTAITKFSNMLLAGHVPKEVAPYFCGAKLHGAIKKDGGLRPIAVGEILRRLAAKCAAKAVAPKAANLLSPLQLGVGVRGGCEGLVHTVQTLLHQETDGHHMLQVDFINAFNLASRQAAYEEVKKSFPELAHWVASCYGVAAQLVYGDVIITSTRGFHQGDPLATLLFSLVLHPVITKINEEIPSLLVNGWFLDDGLLGGTKEELTQATNILLDEGPDRGLHLSTERSVPGNSKSAVWCSEPCESEDPLGLGIKPVTELGFVHLGAPVGNMDFVKNKIESRIEKVRVLLDKLPHLSNPHAEFVLLRSCFSLPKISYLMRVIPPFPTCLSLWNNFDGHVRDSLNRVLGSSMSDHAWQQSQLPVSLGGLGIRGAVHHSSSAYLASSMEAQDIVNQLLTNSESVIPHTDVALNHLSGVLDLEERLLGGAILGESQRCLSLKVDTHQQQKLADSISEVRDKARLASLSLPHSGDWLYVVPSVSLGLQLRPSEFRLSVLYRLGLPIFQEEGPCIACGQLSDIYGDHAISCGSQGERISRHNHLRDAIYHAAVSASLGPTREDRALLPGVDQRPADIFIPHWAGGQDAALDVTVTSSLQLQTVNRAATEPGYALRVRRQQKWNKYGELCRAEGIVFHTLPVEALGGWDNEAVEVLKRLGQALARSTCQEEGEVTKHLFGRLSILLMKGNSSLIQNRVPTHPDPQVDGHI